VVRWSCLFALLLLATPAAAETGGGAAPAGGVANRLQGVAVVDFSAVRRDATAAKAIAQKLETFVNAYQNDVEREESALREAQEALKRRQAALPSEAYAVERRSWEQAVADAQRRFMRRRQAMDEARGQAWQQVNDALGKVVRALAAERNLRIVLRRDQAFWVAPELEVTDEVLNRLNEILPTVEIQPIEG
jgi:Skp family chaperone for outer membrane proteins